MFPFYGSKWNLARRYPPPRHSIVIEPFAGSAGYSTFYEPLRVELYEKDPIIAGVWAYLLRVSRAEILALPELPHVGDSVDDHPLPQEAKWLIGFWLNRGSSMPKKRRTAYSARTDRSQLNWSPGAKARIASQLPLLEHWTIREGSFELALNAEATWFVDPPYVEKGKFYRENFVDYAELGRWARDRRGMTIVCEGPGADWLPFERLGSFKSSKGRSDEFAWISEFRVLVSQSRS